MTIVLTTHRDRPAVQIEDHKGEIFSYTFALVSVPHGWAVRLAKIDPESGEVETEYTVSNARDGWWICTCPDYKYRPQVRERGCKHVRAARELKQLHSAMTGTMI